MYFHCTFTSESVNKLAKTKLQNHQNKYVLFCAKSDCKVLSQILSWPHDTASPTNTDHSKQIRKDVKSTVS